MKILGWVALLVTVVACSKSDDASSKPIDPKVWREKNQAVLDAWTAKLDAAVALTKDLPAVSVHHADPDGVFQVFRSSYAGVPDEEAQKMSDNRNAVILQGTETPGLPEYKSDRGKDIDDWGVSVNYMGFVEWEALNVLLEGEIPRHGATVRTGENLVREIQMLRYLIMTRTLEYQPGTINVEAQSFTPGVYKGVAHVVDLQGPKHLGSVAFSATNSGSIESYAGSEKFMLRADLQSEAMRCAHFTPSGRRCSRR